MDWLGRRRCEKEKKYRIARQREDKRRFKKPSSDRGSD